MNRQRIRLDVFVDLDPIPGAMHSKESVRNAVANILESQISHYNPRVSTTNDPDRPVRIAIPFNRTNPYWSHDNEQNRVFLKCQINWFHDLLASRGHLFLNEVYDALGMERTSFGTTHGWLSHHEAPVFLLPEFASEDGSFSISVAVHGDIHTRI